jgi:hypothetical protein
MRKIWAGIREGPELFFQKKLKQTITYHFPVLLLYFWHLKKNSCSPAVCWHENYSIWLRNDQNNDNCLMIGTCWVMGGSTIYDSMSGNFVLLTRTMFGSWKISENFLRIFRRKAWSQGMVSLQIYGQPIFKQIDICPHNYFWGTY